VIVRATSQKSIKIERTTEISQKQQRNNSNNINNKTATITSVTTVTTSIAGATTQVHLYGLATILAIKVQQQ